MSASITQTAEKFFDEQRILILATVRKNGTPQLSPVWFIWKDGALVISTAMTTAKWVNLVRDPRCTAIIDDPGGRYLIASGVAELDDGDVYDLTRELISKYKTDEEIEAYMESIYAEGRRTIIKIVPERVVTWNID
jgi:PPOX class probable F420-dependent enzyme